MVDHIYEAYCEVGLLFAHHWGTYANTDIQLPTTFMVEVRLPIFCPSVCCLSHETFSGVAVHVGVAALLLVAVIGACIQMLHAHSRRNLHLHHQPGTIASAVSIGAQTQLGNLLHGQQDEGAIRRALQNRKFRIHPQTNKILVQGESGYEEAATPNIRQTFFQSMRSPKLNRFSRAPPASA